ncbi:MAG TPA: DMT family transporter [Ramlibacter sp.]|nr:DMT family transporter [Ramlibacter sp.]
MNAATDFVLLSAIWGASFMFTRMAVGEFGALPTAAARVAIAALFLLPMLLARGLGGQLRKHWKATFVIGMLNSGIPFTLYAFALQSSISTGLSAILNATTPMFGALVAWVWLRDKPDGSRLLGLVLGFTGIALLASEKASFQPVASGVAAGWAVLACLLACLCYGIAASASKLHLSGLPPLVTATGSQIGATVGLALPTAWAWPAQMPGPGAWLAATALGVVCTGLAYVLFFRLVERVGPARTLAVPFVVPVFAVIYGAVFLHEAITAWMLMCGAVIVIGTALSTGVVRLGRRRAQGAG